MSPSIGTLLVVLSTLVQIPIAVGASVPAAAQERPQRIPVRIIADRLVVSCDVSSPRRRIPVNLFVETEAPVGLVLHNKAAFPLGAETQDGQPVPLTLHFPDFELVVPRREHGDEKAFEDFTKYYSAELGENALVGVLGAQVFKDFDLTYDLNAGFVELRQPLAEGSELSELPSGVRQVPITSHHDMVWLPVQYPDLKPAAMALGTIHYDTLVDAMACEELGHPAGDLDRLLLSDVDLTDFVALRPEEVVLTHPDGVAGQIGLNFLRHWRVEVDRTHRVARLTQTAPAKFPVEDQAFFRAMVEEDGDAVQEFLVEYPEVRLSHEAAELLLSLRLDEGADPEVVGGAIGYVASTSLEDLRTTRMLDLMGELSDASYPEFVVTAGELGIESGRKDRYPEAVHKVHSKMGAVLLEDDEGLRAWKHLLSAAFGLPEDGMVNLNLGRYYEQEGRVRRAFSRYVQACIRPESGPEAMAGLQRLQDQMTDEEAFSVDLVERMVGGKVRSFSTAQRFEATEESFQGRTALVEFFTNANLGDGMAGAIGGALGNEGLLSYFEPDHAVFLSYHLPVPAPDALVNELAMDTARWLQVGNPVVHVVNGTAQAPGAARWRQAEDLFNACKSVIEDQLVRSTPYTLELDGSVDGDLVTADVICHGPERTGLRLSVVLAEKGVLMPGKSEIVVHRMLARAAMTPDTKGMPYEPVDGMQRERLQLSLADVRAANTAWLDQLETDGVGSTVRMSMGVDPDQVRLVAILRAANGEVLQAAWCNPVPPVEDRP